MRTGHTQLLAAAAVVWAAAAWGQGPWDRPPHIGYLYPSGGQQGTVVHVTVGGQYLRGVSDVVVSGEGVRALTVQYNGRLKRLSREEREELIRRLRTLRKKRSAAWSRYGRLLPPEKPVPDGKRKSRSRTAGRARNTKQVELPDHPLLNDLDNLNFGELMYVVNTFLRPANSKRQPNAQIAETVLVELTIDDDATPGDREFRLKTPRGLANHLRFQVGVLPEIYEPEPYNDGASPTTPVALPILVNGQIMPGDVDRIRFNARRGQEIVINTQARHLIPFLADAVPGWFQATLALYDGHGKEVAFVDDYRFYPDPVLFYEIPETGVYELEIRDSIYRGREDFVYRVAVGELPFITSTFPLGGRAGRRMMVTADGWNLPKTRLPLGITAGEGFVRHTVVHGDKGIPNDVTYAVDNVMESEEAMQNDTIRRAQSVTLPRIVNGRIEKPGDVDVFRFGGRAGQEIIAEVNARRLQSPLDSLLRLTDVSGNVLAWNDDQVDKKGHLHRDMGALTHHADSYLRARLLSSGVYYIHLSDTRQHGGSEYAYRLRISRPRPNFALLVAPSTINVRAGRAVAVWVHALRKDGFDGDIEIALRNAPVGFKLQGGRIPAGSDGVRVTLTAPREPTDEPVTFQLEGCATIVGKKVRHTASPAEDLMQAFLWRHLLPSGELVVAVLGPRNRRPPPELTSRSPVRIPVGGSAQVRLSNTKRGKLENMELVLQEPPKGVAIGDVTASFAGLKIALLADETAQAGLADNLIVEAFMKRTPGNKNGKPLKKRRFSLGILPAIPFEIVQR